MALSSERAPFPYSVFEGAGFGFTLGMIGSSPFHFFKGPMGTRLEYIAMKAPRTGGSFAVWSALYDTMSSGLAHVRHKEDPWNSILAGGFTSALFSVRQGFRPAFNQFLIGGALFAGIEGVMIMLQRVQPPPDEMQSQINYPQYSVPSPVTETEKISEPGWFRRRFGRGKDNDVGKKNEGDDGSKATVLKSVDTLPPPMPTFNF